MNLPSREQQIASKCKHFNGIMQDTCRAGIRYDDVKNPDATPRIPCLRASLTGGTDAPDGQCPKREWPTAEEVRHEIDEGDKAVRQYLEELSKDICPHCHQPIKSRRKVGRCFYAQPCNHRLYQSH